MHVCTISLYSLLFFSLRKKSYRLGQGEKQTCQDRQKCRQVRTGRKVDRPEDSQNSTGIGKESGKADRLYGRQKSRQDICTTEKQTGRGRQKADWLGQTESRLIRYRQKADWLGTGRKQTDWAQAESRLVRDRKKANWLGTGRKQAD